MKPIEVLGKMKEFNWFARGADVQIGIFASSAAPLPSDIDFESYEES